MDTTLPAGSVSPIDGLLALVHPRATRPESGLYIDSPRVGPAVPGRIPVYAPFRAAYGPVLARRS